MKISVSRLPKREGLVVRSMLRVLHGMLDECWDIDEEHYDLAIYDPLLCRESSLNCRVKVAMLGPGDAVDSDAVVLRRPIRISLLRAILNQAARDRRETERPLLRSGSLQDFRMALRDLVGNLSSPTALLITIDDLEAILDSKSSMCRWRFTPQALDSLHGRHDLDISVSRLSSTPGWTPIHLSTVETFFNALSPEPCGLAPEVAESVPVWKRAVANLSVLQRIRLRLGIA